uniref:Uncharacterized protein n=1 Tax=Daphnia galeata TaxID=27404 RepID=A0A8J2RGC3_9CRUS|nr:unnamed protein product [Daphnia galeata]
MSIHVGRKKLGQMEMEATQTLVISMTSLCFMPCLNFVFMATFFACRLVFDQLECSNLNGIGYFTKEMSLIPAIYGPIIFLDADGHQIQTVETIHLGNVTERNESRAAVVQNDGTYPIIRPMSIHVNQKKLCQMEIEATRTFNCWSHVGHHHVFTSNDFRVHFPRLSICNPIGISHLNWLAPYMIELGLVNIVSSPLIFIVRNKELRTALTCRLNQV